MAKGKVEVEVVYAWRMVRLGLQALEFKNSRNDGRWSNTGGFVQNDHTVSGKKEVVTMGLL